LPPRHLRSPLLQLRRGSGWNHHPALTQPPIVPLARRDERLSPAGPPGHHLPSPADRRRSSPETLRHPCQHHAEIQTSPLMIPRSFPCLEGPQEVRLGISGSVRFLVERIA